MDQRGNFSAGVPNRIPTSRAPPNFPRPAPIYPAKSSVSPSPKKNNTLIFIMGSFLILFIVIGAIFFLISKDRPSEKTIPISENFENQEVKEITSGGCEKLGLSINENINYTCFDVDNKLLKVYMSRDLENVILKRINFKIFSESSSLNYSSSYGLSPGAFYVYQIDFNESSVVKLGVSPVVQDDGGEKECGMIYAENILPCVAEEVSVEPAIEYAFDENMNVVSINQSKNVSVNQSEPMSEWDLFLNLLAEKPQKKIVNFSIDSIFAEIDEVRHSVFVRFPDNRSIVSLSPSIQISANATIFPSSGLARDFTNPVVYTVTSSDESTQNYTVYVSISSEQPIPEVAFVDNNAPVVYLYSIDSSNLTAREILFRVSDESNISQCTLYSGENIYTTLSDINKTINNTLSVSDLTAGLYSYSIKCNDSIGNLGVSNSVNFRVHALNVPIPVDGACGSANRSYVMNDSDFGSNSFCTFGSVSSTPQFPAKNSVSTWQCLGLNGGNNASCSAKRVIVTSVLGIVAGSWSNSANSLVAAELMAKLNKNYYIINVGNLRSCSYCISAERNVFNKSEFKQWAFDNGIAMVYSDDSDYSVEPAKTVRARYTGPIRTLNAYPILIIVGYESTSTVAAFTYRKDYYINGIKAVLTPASFIQIADSYTQKYK